jgi:hypothetical protein
MNNILRNILAVIVGLVVGNIANMGLLVVGGQLIPPPPGVDVSSVESIKSSIHFFQAQHFIFPFLAHAGGTLFGALVASLIAGSNRFIVSMIIGGFFLLGGIIACFMIPAPVWFIALDLIFAYLPMAWLGRRLSGKS